MMRTRTFHLVFTCSYIREANLTKGGVGDHEHTWTQDRHRAVCPEAYVGASCPELVAKVCVPLGHPVEAILEAAHEEGCDAIVLGTHGKGFLKQTFLGSTAAKVLGRTRKQVFVIPLPHETADIYRDGMR